MKFGIKKIIFLSFLLVVLFLLNKSIVYGDDKSTISECQQLNLTKSQCVDHFAQQKSDLGNQDNTTTNQIALMTNQINLTEARIEATQEQLTSLTLDIDTAVKKISGLQSALEKSIAVLVSRIVATYEVGTIQPVQILLTSNNASDFITRLNYLRLAQAHDKKLIYDTQQAKVDYTNQKDILQNQKAQVEQLKKQLQIYTDQLTQEKAAQQQLLAQIKQREIVTDSMLTLARAQLAALSSFATSVGGASLISHQDMSDGWGKYYNQRDDNWGNVLINDQSTGCGPYPYNQPCTVWRVGCTITAYAMVVTHFGGSMNPADVATSGNFENGTAWFNAPGPSASGHSAEYVTNPSLQSLRDALNSNHGTVAIVAGLSMDGGPFPEHYSDHWVVLRSVNSDGSFQINDPEYQDMNVNLNNHYSSWTIIEARIYR
jgi:peptidoglycan hydrolase CwlO-like protein